MQKLRKNSTLAALVALLAVPLSATALDHHDEGQEKEMTAEIVDVDVEANTITLKRMDAEVGETTKSAEYSEEHEAHAEKVDEELVITIDDDTRITDDGDLIALSALEPGERVNVRYTETEDDRLKILGIVIYTTS